jgi:hypothetical protein
MNTLAIKTLKTDFKRIGLSLLNLALIAWLSVATLTQPAQAATPHWLTVVSLTFDDGLNQSPVRNLLASHGMQGTFYINSNLIGSGGNYLTKAELDALYADGNEIGGHTIDHVDLATLSDSAQKTAICNDMQNLVNWGYQVHSFAYPYGSTGPNSQSIVAAGCPGAGTYESARTVGGLVTGTACSGCSWAETIPPVNPYYISTNNSLTSTTTLAEIQSYVTQAETNGGGWVPLVIHQICNGCSTYSISQATLDSILTWLKAREAQGTYVRTVHQVMSGDLPAPPPPPQPGLNQLINPSLEIDADGNNQADCWQRDGYGTNKPTWTRTNDAHTGSFAEQLKITSYTNGDDKLLPTQDAGQPGGCAPTAVGGKLYQLSAWYKATVPADLVLFYLDASGVWQYWHDGPQLPASASWTQMTYYPGAVPTGAQAMSFGIALSSIGTLTTDDYSMALVQDNPPSDSIPPVISGFAPANGAAVSGTTVSLTASATDNVAVQRVEFLIGGSVIATDTTSPYAVSWNSTSIVNGSVNYSVRAVDAAGNTAVSSVNQLIVDNTPPVISGFAPANAATVSGTVSLTASATDNVAIQRVEFLINGSVIATATTSPYAASWGSTSVANGSVNYSVRAVDTAGNAMASSINQLTVANNSADSTPPVISGFAPADAATVSGTVSLTASATDNVAVQRVEFLIGGTVIATATSSPYAASWNSTSVANGSVSYAVQAFDAAGNSTVTATRNITVSNPTGNLNLLTNPSLEIDANNDKTPDCWQLGGYGANTYTWTRLSGAATAHSGNFAESVKVTSLTSGDRKLVQLQDSSTCAPTVTVGARYTVNGWYKSTAPIQIAVYYRTSGGTWQFWQSSANFAATTNWAQASYTTTSVPAGATAISFGLYISKAGTLVTDDYAMVLAP